MATNTEFLDAVFGGTKAVLNTAQNVAGAFAQGVNDVSNIMGNSRRNQMGPQYTNGYGNGVNMPVTYPYPYSDTPTYGNMMMPMNSEPALLIRDMELSVAMYRIHHQISIISRVTRIVLWEVLGIDVRTVLSEQSIKADT